MLAKGWKLIGPQKTADTSGYAAYNAPPTGPPTALPCAAPRQPGAPMHLKSYQIDDRMLRTGTANFSASGLKRQDNDLIAIESADAAAAFSSLRT